jgi:hypothetical protein
MKIKLLVLSALASLVLALGACGGGSAPEGGIGGSGAPLGTLKLSLADAPACGYDAVNITVQEVRVNQSATAGDGDAGWYTISLAPPQRLDLLSLTNGVLFELGQTPLPAGTYTQMRLVLSPNTAGSPLANSVVPTGGSEVPLTTPSAQQSGLKANIDIDVHANQLADFVVDFDACKSVVSAGNSGKYLLQPVITVVPNLISGVAGYVDPAIANGQTMVSLEQGGVEVKSTVPDPTGKFLLEPVVPGTYDLVIAAPGRATAVVTAVVVSDQLLTSINTSATDVNPPASATGTIQGTVSTGVLPIDALVGAGQALTGGDTITVGAIPADAVTGTYALVLPTGAPVVAPFAAGLPLAFAPDAGAAGIYTVTAASGGATKSAGPITLADGATVTQDFVFP